ncbi:MAG: response regulator [Desulfitobacteriaceae bacterium]|nr:response regulator [Desulfitobacteriaceae bacterium]MDI6913586.1 response regulator [Desulfitobacteriaceae bacterium]
MRILIIDDDEFVRYTLNEICLFAGWQALLSRNGNEGLSVFDEIGADVVLVDYHMSGMDGLTTVRELRKRDAAVPILVLTVDERQSVAEEFLDAGATDFAIKPVRAPDLISRIQLHIRLSKLTRANSEVFRPDDVYVTKGISKPTLEHIVSHLKTQESACTVEEIARDLGLAYPTVHRYLTYLTQQGKIRIIVGYKKVGRPKHQYQWI